MSCDELSSLMALNFVLPTSPRVQQRLLERFGSASAVFRVAPRELMDAGFVNALQADRLRVTDPAVFAKKREQLEAKGVTVLSWQDPRYPIRLHNVATYPTLIYIMGDPAALDRPRMLGVVGSRRMTNYGSKVLKHLVPELCAAGFVIVSGMALGVDGCAHQATLDADGVTVGVQAQGVLMGYPRRHQELYDRVLRGGGAIVSEFSEPPADIPEPRLFPRRNRLISGLSLGVLVVEAAQKSGALITAEYALDQGRNVYAVPGDIFQELSAGCNRLIMSGAKPVLKAADILDDFGVKGASPKQLPLVAQVQTPAPPAFDHFASPLEGRILMLCREPVSMDDLQEETGESAAALSAVVTKLELLGRLNTLTGRRFVAA